VTKSLFNIVINLVQIACPGEGPEGREGKGREWEERG
jgi:hypothetical protein